MKVLGAIALVGVGVLIGLQLRGNEKGCCAQVAAGVRAEVRDSYGPTAVAAGDLLNAWGIAPAVLQAVGYQP